MKVLWILYSGLLLAVQGGTVLRYVRVICSRSVVGFFAAQECGDLRVQFAGNACSRETGISDLWVLSESLAKKRMPGFLYGGGHFKSWHFPASMLQDFLFRSPCNPENMLVAGS